MFLTINRVVNGKCVKYDTRNTEQEAISRVEALHAMGTPYDKAYYVDMEPLKDASRNVYPIHYIEHWNCDDVAKTMVLDKPAIDLNISTDNWLSDIATTDSGMPRHMEDLITNNASLVIPAEMKKRYDDKIKVRSERP